MITGNNISLKPLVSRDHILDEIYSLPNPYFENYRE